MPQVHSSEKMCSRNTVKVVLLTDKLDKSEVEYQGSYDDVVEVPVLFDVRSGRSFCVGAVCAEVIEDLSLSSLFATHVLSIYGDGGLVNVHLAEFSLERATWLRVSCTLPSFFQCSPARLSNGGFLRFFFLFRSCRVVTGRPRREARRNCFRSNARQTQQGQVGVRAGSTIYRGTTAAVCKTGPPHSTVKFTGRYARTHTSARSDVV